MLTGQGSHIVHNTEHTPLEFGKDVIAVSPDSKLVGYQLKGHPGGTLKPRDFGEIRGQLEQLATLALAIPGFEGKVPAECYLVTNGEIDEAVYHQIQLLNASLVQRGHPPEKIKTITRGKMLGWVQSLGLSLWPSEMADFGNLVKLLNYSGDEMFPAQVFDPLLQHTLRFDKEVKSADLSRRVTSAAVMTAVALHSFSRRKKNHFAEITAWTMFITYAIAACQKNGIDYAKHCKEAVLVARDGIYDLLGQLCEEASERKVLVEGDPYSEFAFYQPRVLLVSALMAIYWIWSEAETWKRSHHKALVEKLIPESLPSKWLWGEGVIPNFLTYIWYRKRIAASSNNDVMVATVLAALLRNKVGADGGEPLASPYYDAEELAQHRYQKILGCPDPFEGDGFEGDSYFCETLMMCLVRSNLKQTCQNLWPDFTRLRHERVVPDQAWQFGLYRTGDAATNETQIYPPTVQWSELQAICEEHEAADVPAALKADPVLLLLFVNIFRFGRAFLL
jgi:hypothetical protein